MFGKLDYIEYENKPHKAFKHLKAYDLQFPIEHSYKKSDNKILVVMGNVNFRDLRDDANGRILGDKTTRKVLDNILSYAWEQAQNIDDKAVRPAFSMVNFDLFDTRDLSDDQLAFAHKQSAKRISGLVDKLKPHKLLVIGDVPTRALLGDDGHLKSKRGNPHKFKTKKHKCTLFPTITYDPAFTPRKDTSEDLDDDAVTMANILGYVSRNLRNCILGRNPFSLKDIKFKTNYINTIEKFDKLMDKLMKKADKISLDIETENLSHNNNRIWCVQVAYQRDEAHFIPVMHKDSPFSAKEVEHIRQRFREFFMLRKVRYHPKNEKRRYLMGQNFGFDLRVMTTWCDVPYVYWPVWDTIAGEYCLDENLKALQSYGNTPYSLDTIFASYENYHYYSAAFKKSDRVNIGKMDLNADVIEYGCMDVVSVYAIHEKQIEQASYQTFGKKATAKYSPFYINLMLGQMSNIVKVMSRMSTRGVTLDVPYLVELMGGDSKITKMIDEQLEKLHKCKSVRLCEKRLKEERGVPSKTLFGKSAKGANLFDISKSESQQMLFFDVLGLEPTSVGKDGSPSVGKEFKNAYKDDVKEVAIFEQIEKLKKLKSAFIDTMYTHLSNNVDSHEDHRLRPGFGYKDVVTGRSNSFKPSLQQIPVHSAEAKYVKRMFISPEGSLCIDVDYSSHEVRCGGYISNDQGLLGGFRKIHDIIVEYRRYPSAENLEALLTKGDSHKMNYSFFTGMPIEEWVDLNRSKEGQVEAKALRQISKGIVFGAFYGKGPTSVARDIGKSKEDADDILQAFFKKFHVLKDWLEWTKAFSQEHLYTFSPLGRKRNLFGYMAEVNAMIAAMERRAQNSPIQGMASDISFNAADIFARVMFESLEKLGDWETLSVMPTGPNVMVHDSIKTEAKFKYLLLTMHLMEWSMTTGVEKYLGETFGMQLDCPLNVDFDIGAGWHNIEGWDMNPRTLREIIKGALEEHYRIHGKEDMDIEGILNDIYAKYHDQRKELELDKNFPLNFHQYEPEVFQQAA
ncbi:hypothetical protein GR11A_00012 [Vibrio phage vB_VcorM_GR11A]|nr:hypothetical protein GR11A_00012 [Vibrio phage vB_VcorM_GR11A]